MVGGEGLIKKVALNFNSLKLKVALANMNVALFLVLASWYVLGLKKRGKVILMIFFFNFIILVDIYVSNDF